jgi:hypothetical protein
MKLYVIHSKSKEVNLKIMLFKYNGFRYGIYSYFYSYGKTNLPPTLFKDEKGNEFIGNDTQSKDESIAKLLPFCYRTTKIHCKGNKINSREYYHIIPENKRRLLRLPLWRATRV